MTYSSNSNSGDQESYLTIELEELKTIRDSYKTTKINDSRITNFGRFLRKTSLDEIPQFYSVLKGDMSLVGPRPDPPIQRADYDRLTWIKRCKVKSGITGLAQINGRSSGGVDQRIKNDLYWVDNISIFLYFKVLLKTPLVLSKNNN
jgi:lipopolysaccharide/colanic/teichoic acid biosynthesis glycosyltransferase